MRCHKRWGEKKGFNYPTNIPKLKASEYVCMFVTPAR